MMNASRHWVRTSALEILSIVFPLLVLCFEDGPKPANATMREDIRLVQSVLRSDIIVVGKLINVKEDAIVIKHEQYSPRWPKFYIHLDKGGILVTRVLYRSHLPYKPKSSNVPIQPLPFTFHSRNQLQPNGRKVWVSSYLLFKEGSEGIWLLKYAPFAECISGSRLSVDSLQVVGEAIEKVVQIMNDIQSQNN